MPTCLICLNSLRSPAVLPCGHVFCHDCIVRVVRNVEPFTHQHFCPTCRAPFTITNVDPQLIPSHMRPYLTPAIRKLALDFTIPSSTPHSTPVLECDRLRAENASLRSCCEIWRKRAAVHAAASLGLVGLARLARDHAIKMRKEYTELHHKHNALKRKYEGYESHASELTTPPAVSDLPQLTRSPAHPPSPSLASSSSSPSTHRSPSPCASELSYCSDCSDCEPALKRLRVSSHEPEHQMKQSPAASPILALTPAPFEDS